MALKFPEENWHTLLNPERQSWQNLEDFFRVVKPASEEIWADIGCGPGYFTLPLARRLRKVYAIDQSPFMLERCRERAQKEGLKNIEYILCEEDRIPLEDKAVSVSLIANLFHELLRPEDFLEEVARITSHRIILIDWHPVPSPAGPPLEERVPEEEVLSFMEKRGFKLLERHNVFPYHYFLIFAVRET